MSDTENIEAAVSSAAEFVQRQWQQAAMGTLAIPGMRPVQHNIGLRRLYANSIALNDQIAEGGSIRQRIIAKAKIAEQLESGTGPWDMKPMLLNGPKARMGKNGRYNIIPFRHGTIDKYSPDNNFKTMPKDIYQQARVLKASLKQGNGMSWGGKLTGTEAKYAPGQNPTSGYQHKSGKYEGMVRIEKTAAKATQSKYMTFRVVSDNSDPGSWIHPGYKAHNIAKSVADFCRPAVESMIHQAAIADLQAVIVTIGT